MIEIFKTNITNPEHAQTILTRLHAAFPGFQANLDLTDCDHILRVCSNETLICSATIISLVKSHGFFAEVLPDEMPEKETSGMFRRAFQSE